MEPFRILVDRETAQMELTEFSKTEKYKLVNILNHHVEINGTDQTVLNAIRIYIRSILASLNENGQGLRVV